ncbi:MAG: hypothetical protein OWV35_00605, partial [Firmicutes bacterium]|nr:hypothetical protein [Bacillota bacterium]
QTPWEVRHMAVATDDFRQWGGAGLMGLVDDYADNKMRRFVASLTNGELLNLAAVALQVFTGTGSRYRRYIDGAADYAVGQLVRNLIGPHITGAAVSRPVPTVTVAAKAAPSGVPGGPTSGLAGVPAPAGSAAFDQVTPGF